MASSSTKTANTSSNNNTEHRHRGRTTTTRSSSDLTSNTSPPQKLSTASSFLLGSLSRREENRENSAKTRRTRYSGVPSQHRLSALPTSGFTHSFEKTDNGITRTTQRCGKVCDPRTLETQDGRSPWYSRERWRLNHMSFRRFQAPRRSTTNKK